MNWEFDGIPTSPAATANGTQAHAEDSMNSTIQWEEDKPSMTRIKVIGVGGGGCNAVEDMITKGFSGVEFYAVNTDFQALERCKIPNKIQIGEKTTSGLGAGAIPELGAEAARAAENEIRAVLQGSDMVFVTAGMGGGTGTGAAPVIAEIAKSMDILSVAIVTKPFLFEGQRRMRNANSGILRLKENVDTMIVILNDKLMETVGPKTPLTQAFKVANDVLAQGIRAISDLISKPGLINVDFRDVRTIMGETGGAVMGVGIGKGENRSIEAVKKACHSPLQEKIVIDGARGVLINITGGPDITMMEINEATSSIYESADPDANIIFGFVIDETMKDEMRVTIIATGFSEVVDSAPTYARPALRFRQEGEPEASSQNTARPAASTAPIEPNPIPAYQRKHEVREPEPAQPMRVDFERADNPLKDWDEPARHEPQAATPPPLQAQPQQPQASAYQPFAAAGTEEKTPTAFILQDSQQGDDAGMGDDSGDPMDIPALARRRRQRFFE